MRQYDIQWMENGAVHIFLRTKDGMTVSVNAEHLGQLPEMLLPQHLGVLRESCKKFLDETQLGYSISHAHSIDRITDGTDAVS